MSLSTVLAKALFDNAAESPEELAFRKGDILMVLEQEQGGGPGWWLCSLHGRQGIAPANRLRLLHTAPAPGVDSRPPSRAPSEDSVYLSPVPLARTAVSTEDVDGVYRTPPSLGEALYQSPGAVPVASRPGVLREAEVGGRPRSRSSSGTRPCPDWDVGVTGRPRSPSLRSRGTDSAGSLYQTPSTPTALGPQHHRGLAGDPGPENVYLAPGGIPRAVGLAPEGPEDNTYLVPRETVAAVGHSDGCYLVPRGMVLPSEEVYQTPTGGLVGGTVSTQVTPITTRVLEAQSFTLSQINGGGGAPLKPLTPQSKLAQDTPRMMYQTPTPVGAGILRTPPVLAQGSPKPQLKGVTPKTPGTPGGQGGVPSTPPITRGKLAPSAPLRGSPLLARTGQGHGQVPGSPNFARKPPPPAPPVRGVTRKDLPQSVTPVSTSQPALSTPQSTPVPQYQESKDGRMASNEKKPNGQNKKGEDRECADPDGDSLDEQVYDTPPRSKWQRPAPAALCDDDSIYNTPRSLPPHTDLESEVYDVPTIILSTSSEPQQQTVNVPTAVITHESEEDVYSLPTLPGLPLGLADMSTIAHLEGTESGQVYSVPGSGKRAPLGLGEGSDPGSTPEPDCGVYDMPALTLDVLPSSTMSTSSSSSTRRLSVSSNGSGDVQWRNSLSGLVQSVLSSASCAPVSSRDLATSLAEILSVWKTSQPDEVPPPLQQAWAHLSDLLPALSAGGHAPPSDALLSMVQRALEDSTILFQTQGRPRLPSQDSLSRRPLPALPVAEVKPVGSSMGPRKGSWIQERPLPPTPQPAFPRPPAQPSTVTMSITVGQSDGEEGMGNEYAGIGLTPAPAPLPLGDSVGYVKLQGKPEPPSDARTENRSNQTLHTTEPRLSPSPPLPVSLSLEDSELLSFYSSQSLSHLSCLADSIDVLFRTVQGNQPPRIFVSRGKSLIVTAHKLVFIGDTLSRLLTSPDLRAKVTTSGGHLCQALKAVVVATKGAAQNYPSVAATQEMVNCVAELSQHAAGFSGLLQLLAEIS
ncbi:embryonal Fyn-associated substrate isoform X1 [Oncorhynchus keta]|uniref:embryonal Fyn-associated substrate isoform X1 n=1 Tax=Oncorhynchus keta TaxID=8018 RepID=UPI0015F84A30|nr:embryonal Fyn-associated substrate isoform X1 [Oncorhynchus keta]XP_035639616.1 embryonal Fyn-associated substrate isoform X1 [Oncorhynchus keta]